VSRAGRRNVERLLALSDIADVFEIVVTADDVGATAAPGTHRLALDRLRVRRAVPPARAIALEDGPAGIRAARAVGLRCVAVGPLPPHQALEADGYLPSLEGETLDTLAQVAARRDERVR
jgi:beta-phosphoglucomutase-like phosphatase (HAD superfamily)